MRQAAKRSQEAHDARRQPIESHSPLCGSQKTHVFTDFAGSPDALKWDKRLNHGGFIMQKSALTVFLLAAVSVTAVAAMPQNSAPTGGNALSLKPFTQALAQFAPGVEIHRGQTQHPPA
ncbi:MAG TPA: hypothetical protein VFK24_05865 [Gammaproteobacteria bacterium]|nr:hypothetical protein [Gammaproteobacteria bacterium]